MRTKLICSLGIIMGLTGCAPAVHQETAVGYQREAYPQQARSVHTTRIPQGIATPPMQNYYPVPPAMTTTNTAAAPQSIMPPGSQMAQASSAPMTASASAAPAQKGGVVASSSNALVLNANYDQAWSQIGGALRTAGYKVMQQDKSVGTYYVLDTRSTGGTLKSNTPIYQVHLKSLGANTSVSVLDEKSQPANSVIASRIIGALKQKL